MTDTQKVTHTVTETYVNCAPDEENTLQQIETQKDDILYLLDKAMLYVRDNNMVEAEKCIKRLKLMHDALIVYRLHKGI